MSTSLRPPFFRRRRHQVPNVRKLDELPFHLARARRVRELLDCCLFHLPFLEAKVAALGPLAVLEDLALVLRECGEAVAPAEAAELRLLAEAVRLAAHILAQHPQQLQAQLQARLLLDPAEHPNLTRLCQAQRPAAPSVLCTPLTVGGVLPAGGPAQQTFVGHQGQPKEKKKKKKRKRKKGKK